MDPHRSPYAGGPHRLPYAGDFKKHFDPCFVLDFFFFFCCYQNFIATCFKRSGAIKLLMHIRTNGSKYHWYPPQICH